MIVTSEFYLPQLKKGNKEPNPMVQLSVQDVTRESKVRPGEHCGKCHLYVKLGGGLFLG